MTKNMIFIIIAFAAFFIAARAQADDICGPDTTYEIETAASTHKHTYELALYAPDGTEDSDFYCWYGDTDIDVYLKTPGAELVMVPKACNMFAETDDDVATLNCIQDVTLEGGEKVVVTYTRVLHDYAVAAK